MLEIRLWVTLGGQLLEEGGWSGGTLGGFFDLGARSGSTWLKISKPSHTCRIGTLFSVFAVLQERVLFPTYK